MDGAGRAEGRHGPKNGRRELTIVVLTIVVFAGLALLSASRTWSTVGDTGDQVVNLLPDRTGAATVPALPALAFVCLAGAGALVASRGRVRAAVAVLVMLCGLGMAVLVFGHHRSAPGGPVSWPALAFISGVMVAGMGLRALLCGRYYPSMGTRYERATRAPAEDDLWAAIERGEDPTRDPASRPSA